MQYDPSNPLIVQGDRSVLVEVDNPRYSEARDALAPFAELEKSPEHIHTYRLTPLSLWNAAAAGMHAEAMIDVLRRFSKFPLPTNLATDIAELVGRYGRVRLERAGENLRLVCEDRPLLEDLARQPKVREDLGERLDAMSRKHDATLEHLRLGAVRGIIITVVDRESGEVVQLHPPALEGDRDAPGKRRRVLTACPAALRGCPFRDASPKGWRGPSKTHLTGP